MTWLSAAEIRGGMIHLYVSPTYKRNMQSQPLSLRDFLSYRLAVPKKKPLKTPHQQAEAELTAFGLSLPETEHGPGWPPTRCLKVRGRMFFVFGDRKEPEGALTMIMKLPISAEMVQELYFVRESKGWFKQHDWVIARFSEDDDILAEIDTLKAWLIQSYCAMAPKKLARLVRGEAA
jgi:hypothetical protein